MSKKKLKTDEELLQDALVPLDEQPYEIPSHWKWVKLGSLIKIIRGVSYKKHQVLDRKQDGKLIVRGGNIQNNLVCNQDDNVYLENHLIKSEQILQYGDILMVSSTGSEKVIGKTAFIRDDFAGESFGAFITLLRAVKIDAKFLNFCLLTYDFRNYIRKLASGSNINNVKNEHIINFPIPLPPLDEQKRIAYKIEKMLDKINQSKQLIEEAKQTFELRRAAILEKAFSGELTKKWREESVNGFTVNWLTKSLEDVCVGIFDCPHSTPQYIDEGIPAIRTSDVGFMKINLIAARRVSIEEFNARTSRVIPEIGDIIYCREGTIGNAGIVEEGSMCLAQRVVLFRANEEIIIPRFLCYMLNSPLVLKQVFANISQTTSPRINVGQLKKLQLVVPSLKEQKVIVSMLDKLISLENEFISKFEENSHIDVVENSILSKAFKGEL